MHFNSIFSCVDPRLWGFLYVRTWGLAMGLGYGAGNEARSGQRGTEDRGGQQDPGDTTVESDGGGEEVGAQVMDEERRGEISKDAIMTPGPAYASFS